MEDELNDKGTKGQGEMGAGTSPGFASHQSVDN
jgi:hypothetical protein